MNILKKLYDKLTVKQWSIGLAHADIKEIIRKKKFDVQFKWLSIEAVTRFFADPFLIKSPKGQLYVIYEDFSNEDQYGKISLSALNENFEPTSTKLVLDTNSHLSYPNVYTHNGKTYIMPESSLSGQIDRYEFDFSSETLINKETIINEPLLDSTITFYQNKYWLFATKRGMHSNNKLYIYHSDSIAGPFLPHIKNPVKDSFYNTRPAGNFIEVDGELYRPTQHSVNYYGKAIVINKINALTEEDFGEEEYLIIPPVKNGKYNFATHTLNSTENTIVIDGLRRKFMPFKQLQIFLKKSK